MPKDHERNTSPLQEARKKIAEEKYNTLKTVLEDMIHNEEEITISRVCKLSRLSKSYLHQNERAKKLFNEAKAIAEEKTKYEGRIPASTGLDINPQMRHEDMLLQYEEVKRKLQESYMITFQLLQEENKRLKQEIQEHKEQLESLKKSPAFKLHLIPNERSFTAYRIDSPLMISFESPVEEVVLNGFKWGEYSLSNPYYTFELATPIDGITLEKKDNAYLLTITDKIKEELTIDILMNVMD